ncbi:MAG: hypothetical protein CMJ78_13395 [Planctomycetaceae bacterium]|nr:hypothetical protein [Planctomycetaceae bacterium]
MGWATRYIERLKAGETAAFRPRGQSMTGKIESGQLCTVTPIDAASLEVGDINSLIADGACWMQKSRPLTNSVGVISRWRANSTFLAKPATVSVFMGNLKVGHPW